LKFSINKTSFLLFRIKSKYINVTIVNNFYNIHIALLNWRLEKYSRKIRGIWGKLISQTYGGFLPKQKQNRKIQYTRSDLIFSTAILCSWANSRLTYMRICPSARLVVVCFVLATFCPSMFCPPECFLQLYWYLVQKEEINCHSFLITLGRV
jgi:hypothetical protein